MVVLGILSFQNWLDVDALDFQIVVWSRDFYIFWLVNSFGYFVLKFGQLFFNSSGHPCHLFLNFSSTTVFTIFLCLIFS